MHVGLLSDDLLVGFRDLARGRGTVTHLATSVPLQRSPSTGSQQTSGDPRIASEAPSLLPGRSFMHVLSVSRPASPVRKRPTPDSWPSAQPGQPNKAPA